MISTDKKNPICSSYCPYHNHFPYINQDRTWKSKWVLVDSVKEVDTTETHRMLKGKQTTEDLSINPKRKTCIRGKCENRG